MVISHLMLSPISPKKNTFSIFSLSLSLSSSFFPVEAIRRLYISPGGWFRETHRSPSQPTSHQHVKLYIQILV